MNLLNGTPRLWHAASNNTLIIVASARRLLQNEYDQYRQGLIGKHSLFSINITQFDEFFYINSIQRKSRISWRVIFCLWFRSLANDGLVKKRGFGWSSKMIRKQTFFTREIRELQSSINTQILMQASFKITMSHNSHYASPVKSDPDTQTDECDCSVLQSSENLQHAHAGRSKVKSSLCKNFAVHGYCPYGKKCQFAHGPQELRCNQNINTSYKTKPCFSFLKKGYCPYGHRCNFQHKEEEPKIKPVQSRIISNFPEMVVSLGGAQSKLVSRIASLWLH